MPQLDNAFRIAIIERKALETADVQLRAVLKDILHLPQRATADVLPLPPSWGGTGLLPLPVQADLSLICHCYRLLTSPDPITREFPRAPCELLCTRSPGTPGQPSKLPTSQGRSTRTAQVTSPTSGRRPAKPRCGCSSRSPGWNGATRPQHECGAWQCPARACYMSSCPPSAVPCLACSARPSRNASLLLLQPGLTRAASIDLLERRGATSPCDMVSVSDSKIGASSIGRA